MATAGRETTTTGQRQLVRHCGNKAGRYKTKLLQGKLLPCHHIRVCPLYDKKMIVCHLYDKKMIVCPLYYKKMIVCPLYDKKMIVCPLYDKKIILCPLYDKKMIFALCMIKR